jgi:hypothetical protein
MELPCYNWDMRVLDVGLDVSVIVYISEDLDGRLERKIAFVQQYNLIHICP